jgi:signal peptidase I
MNMWARYRGWFPALLVGVTVWAQPYRPGVVCGNSMAPTLKNGSLYLMDRSPAAIQNIRRGDVVVFKRDGIVYIKRVVAVGGERLQVVRSADLESDELLFDWQVPLMREVLRTRQWAVQDRLVEREIPPDSYYVVGDHMSASEDSRAFGPVPREAILGKMIAPPALPRLKHLALVVAGRGRS